MTPFAPTHRVPAGGMDSWPRPDANAPQGPHIDEGLVVQTTDRVGDWAKVVFDNGWTAEALGVPLAEVVHVGDSWAADYLGARAAGMRAVLFRGRDLMPSGAVLEVDSRGAACESPDELDEVLGAMGLHGG